MDSLNRDKLLHNLLLLHTPTAGSIVVIIIISLSHSFPVAKLLEHGISHLFMDYWHSAAAGHIFEAGTIKRVSQLYDLFFYTVLRS